MNLGHSSAGQLTCVTIVVIMLFPISHPARLLPKGGLDYDTDNDVGVLKHDVLKTCEPTQTTPLSELPICVVGGGISGLVISTLLQEGGKKVILLEKEADHVGGKLDTEKTWEGVWEKGPVLFSGFEPYIHKWLQKYNVSINRWHGENVGLFNPETRDSHALSEEELKRLRGLFTQAADGYAKLYARYPSWLFEPRGFEHVHLLRNQFPDLFLSTTDWLAKYGLSGLSWPFGIIFTCEGYGNIDDLPALYMLKLLNPPVLKSLVELITGQKDKFIDIYTVENGFREFSQRIADRLDCVYQGTNVIHAWREEGYIDIVFDAGSGSISQRWKCSKVVLAFPPLLPKMVRFIPFITKEEKALFSHVKVHKYFSAGHLIEPKGDKNVYLGTDGKGQTWLKGESLPIALVRSGKGKNRDSYTVYSWMYGRYETGPDEEDYGIIDDHLRSFIRDFSDHPPRIAFLEGYEYFPHVSKEAIADGWFANFSVVQGNGGIYYATTASSFESVNTAIENAEAVADLILHS